MSKLDTKKIYKRGVQAHEWAADVNPSKKQKKQKVKERQDGKKQIKKEQYE